MVLSRSSTLRASSIARLARPTGYIRTTRLQPWQRMLQQTGTRSYASEHGAHGAKKSDLPWFATSLVITAAGGFVIFNQDTSHGEGHDDHHAEKHEEHEEKEEEEKVEEKEEKTEEPKQEDKDDSKSEEKTSSKDSSKEESKDDSKAEKKEKKDDKKEAPSKSDEPAAIKPAKSQNEQSGKQQGLDNDDTGHTSAPQDDPQKSSKGEGAAETAKLKGTVSTERPPAENKEERGKSSVDKNK